jgi:hypothetical protein
MSNKKSATANSAAPEVPVQHAPAQRQGKWADKFSCPIKLAEVEPETREGDMVRVVSGQTGKEYGPYRVMRVLNAGEKQLTTFAMIIKEPRSREQVVGIRVTQADVNLKMFTMLDQLAKKFNVES